MNQMDSEFIAEIQEISKKATRGEWNTLLWIVECIEAANKLVGNSPASDGEYFEIVRELEERGLRELSILAKFKRVSMQRAK